MDSRPFQRSGDQAFLGAVAEDVLEALALSGFLAADDNGAIASRPELFPPLHEASGLASKVEVEVRHEVREPVERSQR
jgi:hypothetical protein